VIFVLVSIFALVCVVIFVLIFTAALVFVTSTRAPSSVGGSPFFPQLPFPALSLGSAKAETTATGSWGKKESGGLLYRQSSLLILILVRDSISDVICSNRGRDQNKNHTATKQLCMYPADQYENCAKHDVYT